MSERRIENDDCAVDGRLDQLRSLFDVGTYDWCCHVYNRIDTYWR